MIDELTTLRRKLTEAEEFNRILQDDAVTRREVIVTRELQLREAEDRHMVEVARLRAGYFWKASNGVTNCKHCGHFWNANVPEQHRPDCILSSTTSAAEWLAERDERVRSEERERQLNIDVMLVEGFGYGTDKKRLALVESIAKCLRNQYAPPDAIRAQPTTNESKE